MAAKGFEASKPMRAVRRRKAEPLTKRQHETREFLRGLKRRGVWKKGRP